MTTATPDVPDFDIEAMMAELDAQTSEMIAEAAPAIPAKEPVVEDAPTIKPKMLEEYQQAAAVVVEPSAEEQELADMIASQLANDMPFEPTAVDKMNAEQELDLAEAFEVEVAAEPVVEDVVVEDIVAVEEVPDLPIETHEEVEPESATMVEPEPEVTVEVQNKTIPDFKSKPAEKPERSDKAMQELIKLKYQPDIESFNREIGFTDATLDLAMTSQASLVAYQNERAARASAQAAKLKLKFDGVEAILYDSYRKAFLEAGEKVTEKAIENAVRKDSRWRSAKESVIEAEMYADIHKGFVFALRDRNDMLIQRGSYRRQEMQGQMRMGGGTESNQDVTTNPGHSAAMAALKQAKK